VAATIAGKRQVVFFTGAAAVGLAPENGKLYWRYPWTTDFGVNAATPIVAGDYVFISSGYGKGCVLLKIEPDGDGLRASPVYRHRKMKNHFFSSVRYKDHLYGFSETILTCLNFRTGEVSWDVRAPDRGSLLVADGHLIILGEQGTLALVEATPDGHRQKSAVEFSKRTCWSVPALANGLLYVRDTEKIICLDLRKQGSGVRGQSADP
jgi:outer membrane protein assembly factor BamB